MKRLSRKFRRKSSNKDESNRKSNAGSNMYCDTSGRQQVQYSHDPELSRSKPDAGLDILQAYTRPPSTTSNGEIDKLYDECQSETTATEGQSANVNTSSNHVYSSLNDEDSNAISPTRDVPLPPRPEEVIEANNSLNYSNPFINEFKKLAKQGWYWGPLTREQAERRLCNAPDASFLVRDSSDDRYLLSLSFRSNNRTLHTRIEHSGMRFSFYEDHVPNSYTSVVELIEKSIKDSEEQGVFCYSRSRQPFSTSFPVRLMHPVSRFTEVRSLQDLCRFVIRQNTRVDHIHNLPVPRQLKKFLDQRYF
ncbi:suppressor of cytokine signaling 6-like [Styela clava]